MNYHKNKSQLRSLLHSGWRKKTNGGNESVYNAGCYFISQKEDDNTFKMGLSKNTYNRLSNQYKICFPFKDEFFVKYLVLCHEKDVRELEKLLQDELNRTATKADSLQLISKQPYSVEWFLVSRDARVASTIFNILKKWKKWTHVVRFATDSWKVIVIGDELSWKYVQPSKDTTIINGVVLKPGKISPADKAKKAKLLPHIGTMRQYLIDTPEGEYAKVFTDSLDFLAKHK